MNEQLHNNQLHHILMMMMTRATNDEVNFIKNHQRNELFALKTCRRYHNTLVVLHLKRSSSYDE
jgi:hypothetical protein